MTVLLGLVSGGAGAVLRFLVASRVQAATPVRFPIGTTVVNVTGSFLLGVLVGAGATNDAVALGLLGGYTTFSTWMGEAVTGRDGTDVALRAVLPLTVGIVAAWLGILTGSLVQ